MARRATTAAWALLALAMTACSPAVPSTPQPAPSVTTTTRVITPPPSTTSSAPAVTWQVGARPLPRRPDGFGEIESTPPELVNRAFPTRDFLPSPSGDRYAATIGAVPADVLARSTWQPACPVKATDLRYLTPAFWASTAARTPAKCW